MLAALLIVAQATPLGVAKLDTDELAEALIGTWNNAETVAFASELERSPPAPLSVVFARDEKGTLRYRYGSTPQAYGPPIDLTVGAASETGGCRLVVSTADDTAFLDPTGDCGGLFSGRMTVTEDSLVLSDKEASLHRADPYSCWVSRKKVGEGWTWTPDVPLREGEYVQLPAMADVDRPAGLRLRHVRWPSGPNRDSLVLYIHESAEEPAVSYAWTEPDGQRIAMNLRWVQASCTRVAQ